MERTFIENPEDAEETIALIRELLGSGDRSFPVHLLGEITAALSQRATHGDMVRQLLRLCSVCPGGLGVTLPEGRLLYRVAGERSFVWGSRIFHAADGFLLDPNVPIRIIRGEPCWVERTAATNVQRVCWNGTVGKLYPPRSIARIESTGEEPCYAVNYRAGNGEYVGHIVMGTTEGQQFNEVDGLTVADGEPAYRGRTDIEHRFIWGAGNVCAGQHVTLPIVVDDVPYVAVLSKDGAMILVQGNSMLANDQRIHGPSNVGGQLAYATGTRFASDLHLLGTKKYVEDLDNWWTPNHSGSPFVVYETNQGVWANFTWLCKGRLRPNATSLEPDGHTLRIRVDTEHEPREFDLRALGIIPAKPTTT